MGFVQLQTSFTMIIFGVTQMKEVPYCHPHYGLSLLATDFDS